MTNNLERKKNSLKRDINLPTSILLVAGLMIGSGIFKKISPMAQALHNESLILWAWIVAGLISLFGAFTYAGLSSMVTETGGMYEYFRLIYGDFIAFVFGWSLFTIIGSGAIAALAYVSAQSLNTIFPLPHLLSNLDGVAFLQSIFPFRNLDIKLVGIIAIVISAWVNYRGIKNASKLNSVLTIIKIIGIALLASACVMYANPHPPSVQPLAASPNSENTLLLSSFSALLSALWAFDGWANITFVTGEIKNPKKNIPIAIILGVSITTILYVLLNYAFMKVMPVEKLATINENKIAAAIIVESGIGKFASAAITILIMICAVGALNANIIAFPRVYYRMAEENAFFKKAALVHPIFKTPHNAILYSSIWSCIIVLFGNFDNITNLVTVVTFLFFALATFGLIKMKRRNVITAKVIGYPVIQLVIILFSIALIISAIMIQPTASAVELALLVSAIPFYFYFKGQSKNVE